MATKQDLNEDDTLPETAGAALGRIVYHTAFRNAGNAVETGHLQNPSEMLPNSSQ